MRTTDPDPRPFQPLGEKVPRPAPAAPKPVPVPGAASGIVKGPDGRMQTTKHQA